MAKNLCIMGRKAGMTRIFGNDGTVIPVTVVEAGPCPVIQIKTVANDGYDAIQIGFDAIKESRLSKAEVGHCQKAGRGSFRHLMEMRVSTDAYQLGQDLGVDLFKAGEKVKVTGTSKGKGFMGVMRRWHFGGAPASHGHEKVHRSPGSIGNRTEPGKVFKGKKMAGHVGAKKTSTINVEVFAIRPEDNVILLRGQVPGPKGSLVVVSKQS